MENQNNQNNPNNPIPAQQPLQVPNQPPVSDVPQQTQPPQQPVDPTAPVAQQSKPKLPKLPKMPKFPKGVIIGIGATFVIIILLAISFLMLGRAPRIDDIIPTASTEPSSTPTSAPVSNSPYADDAEILEIKEGISDFDSKMNSTNLREDTLRVPSVEWEISF